MNTPKSKVLAPVLALLLGASLLSAPALAGEKTGPLVVDSYKVQGDSVVVTVSNLSGGASTGTLVVVARLGLSLSTESRTVTLQGSSTSTLFLSYGAAVSGVSSIDLVSSAIDSADPI